MEKTRPVTFYILILTQMLSLLGTAMSGFALALWVFESTHKAAPLLLVAFFASLPTVLGGSLAGVLADRWERRKVIVFTDAMQAVPTLLLLISFFTGYFAVWQLYLGILVQAVFNTLQMPAVDASITMLVPEKDRDRANGIRQMMGPFSELFAPILVAFLYSFMEVEGILLIDLLTFLVSVVVIACIQIPQPVQTAEGRQAQGSAWQEMAGAVKFLRERPSMLTMCVFSTFVNFMLVGPLHLTIPYLMTLTHSERVTGIIAGVINLGPLVGAVVIGIWGGTRPRIHTITLGVLLAGFWMMIYGVARSPFLLGSSLLLLLMPLPAVTAMLTSIIQVKTPPDMQGRIFALLV
ncbi:MAG: MFS transporter [Anaerolineae bacterium]|nr:MFS transporter [Anaerolineae bacterium]